MIVKMTTMKMIMTITIMTKIMTTRIMKMIMMRKERRKRKFKRELMIIPAPDIRDSDRDPLRVYPTRISLC